MRKQAGGEELMLLTNIIFTRGLQPRGNTKDSKPTANNTSTGAKSGRTTSTPTTSPNAARKTIPDKPQDSRTTTTALPKLNAPANRGRKQTDSTSANQGRK